MQQFIKDYYDFQIDQVQHDKTISDDIRQLALDRCDMAIWYAALYPDFENCAVWMINSCIEYAFEITDDYVKYKSEAGAYYTRCLSP